MLTCQAPAPATAGNVPAVLEGHPGHWDHHLHPAEPGIWHRAGKRARKFFSPVTDVEKCEHPSKAQLGASPASG